MLSPSVQTYLLSGFLKHKCNSYLKQRKKVINPVTFRIAPMVIVTGACSRRGVLRG